MSAPFFKQDESFFGKFKKFKPFENLHGSANFATHEQIVEMSLLNEHGAYVGGYYKDGNVIYLRHNGPEHVLTLAPTRSGKGVGLVIPTLLSWDGSVVCNDIKGENHALTSGWRQKHANNVILKFDPAALFGSVKYNPLAEIRHETDYEVSDAQIIATMIVDPDGKGLNDHWAKTGFALLVGAILHCLYVEKAKGRVATILDVANCLADPSAPILDTLNAMLTYQHLENETHPVVASCAREMLNKAENELSGVVSTTMSFLSLYRDPIVARNTSASEFRISDLMNHDRPVSLYIVVRPRDSKRLRPLVRLLMNQIISTLADGMEFENGEPVKSYKHRLLLMIDEFPSLGRMEIFEEALAFIAGYGMKAFLICQDFAQLYKAYGEDESISSNCHIRIAYAPNKQKTAKQLSEMLGTSTITKKSLTLSRGAGLISIPQYSERWDEVQRPLMTPDECSRLPGPRKDKDGKILMPGDMLVFVAGYPPIYGKQILFFKDPVFVARSKVPAPKQTDKIFTLDPNLVRAGASLDTSLELKVAPEASVSTTADAVAVTSIALGSIGVKAPDVRDIPAVSLTPEEVEISTGVTASLSEINSEIVGGDDDQSSTTADSSDQDLQSDSLADFLP